MSCTKPNPNQLCRKADFSGDRMSWFDRVQDKQEVAAQTGRRFEHHAGVKVLKNAGHRVEGDFDRQTITVDGILMTVEGFQAFVKGYAMGRLDERQ